MRVSFDSTHETRITLMSYRFIPKRGDKPAKVDRPDYSVHPEDRVMWRHVNLDEFREANAKYLDDMVNHYHNAYGDWSLYPGDRLRLSRELEFMLDHTGSDFPIELERVEVQQEHPGTDEAMANRKAFIKQYLIPEGLYEVGDSTADEPEIERGLPRRSDLASWDVLGKYLTEFHKQRNEQRNNYYYSGEPYQPQTPEKTVQFFRNLAYRMGRTMRYVGHIKERLQYLENAPQTGASKPHLDLSAEPKEPRPKNNVHETLSSSATVVEKWWHAIPVQDYDLAIEKWSTAVREGSGETALLPPDAKNVLAEADPDSSFQKELKGEQDPFTVIREGIIDDCFQNRPTMYPTRLSGFKDQEDKAYQGYERPSLFVWATKDQRRYQAPHTRRSFFNMKRWPPSLLPPRKLEIIRERKDEIARADPSKPDQAYGILTYRLPVGGEKPIYARPVIRHCHETDYDWRGPGLDSDADDPVPGGDIKTTSSNNNNSNNTNVRINQRNAGSDNNNTASNNVIMEGQDSDTRGNVNIMRAIVGNTDSDVGTGDNTTPRKAKRAMKIARGKRPRRAAQRLVPFAHSDEKFAPGPAVFPFGDTLLQKVSFSQNLEDGKRERNKLPPFLHPPLPPYSMLTSSTLSVLSPRRRFYEDGLFGLSRLWQSLTSAQGPSTPPVPPVARSNIPRSNPMKRTMPIEFLNVSSAAKKYRSDAWTYPEPGSSGGQFGAANIARRTPGEKPAAVRTLATPVTPVTPRKTRTDLTGPYPTPTSADRQFDGVGKRIDGLTPVTPTSAGRQFEGVGKRRDGLTPVTPSRPRAGRPTLRGAPRSRAGGNAGKVATPTQRSYAVPSEEDAKAQFVKTFPGGWVSTPTELQHMYTTALRALEFSINHQLASRSNVRTTRQELKELAQTAVALKPVIGTRNIFNIVSAGYLVQIFGDKHNMKLQLGVTQQDTNHFLSSSGASAKHVSNLVESKYGNDPDKIVVWIRLTDVERFPDHFINPYSKLPYNCYKGIKASVR